MQGAAATINIAKGLDLSPFISLREIDATLSSDSSITTILKTGYHRTKSEMDRKHNSTQFVSGGNLRYFNSGFHIGATGLFTSLNRILKPDIRQLYRRFYPSGKSFWNASVDYGYMGHHLELSGETATGNSGGLATINKVSLWPNNSFTILLLQRFYSYKYYSLFAQSFSDGGTVQNESGIYIGCKWDMSPSLSLSAYSDYAYFAWPKYRISKPSHSFDNLLSMAYQKNALSFMARYRVRFRQQDSDEKSSLASKIEHRARLSAAYDLAQWHFSLQADAAYANLANSFGWMFTPSAGYENGWFLANVYIGYFNTDDYNSRVYTYERGPLYSFTFPVFFGHGLHFSLFAKTKINKNITAIIKSSTTKYFGQEKISSSYQQINSSAMSDLELQLRLKF